MNSTGLGVVESATTTSDPFTKPSSCKVFFKFGLVAFSIDSIEAIYRVLSLPMTKSSIKVKYLSTIHPHFRDGLLKGDMEQLEEGESIFHCSAHDYYSNRELECIDGIEYTEDEKQPYYWEDKNY